MPAPKIDTHQEAFVAILKTREQLYHRLSAMLKTHGLTEPQYNVLRIIRGAGPDGLPCLEIGRRMITRVPDITRLLDRLESDNLVARHRSDHDRRVVIARLTETGRRLLERLDEPIREIHTTQFTALTRTELVEIIKLLEKVRFPA